jgi:hypothetical protein
LPEPSIIRNLRGFDITQGIYKWYCFLLDQYLHCFAFQIFANDTTTKLICQACKEKLEAFAQFKKTCVQSDIALKLKYDTEDDVNAETVSNRIFERSKETQKRKSYSHPPNDESKKLKPTKSARAFITENGIKIYPCRFCNRKFIRIKSIENHEVKHDQQKKSIICDLCGAVLINQQSLKSHKRYKHSDERPFPCEQCNLSFKSRTELTEHVAVCHVRERKFICDICSASFKSLVSEISSSTFK